MSSRTRKILELVKKPNEAYYDFCPTEDKKNSTSENKNVDNDKGLGFFIVGEDGTLQQIISNEMVVDELLNLGSGSSGINNISFPLDVSEAETLTAFEADITCNLQNEDPNNNPFNSSDVLRNTIFIDKESNCSSSSKCKNDVTNGVPETDAEVNGIRNMTVHAEVYTETSQLPDPDSLFSNQLDRKNVTNKCSSKPKVPLANNPEENEIELYKVIENYTENSVEIHEPHVNEHNENVVEQDIISTFEGGNQILKRKRRKRHQVQEDDWQCRQAKILREQGKEYKGRKISDGKVTGYVSRPERSMKPITCKCKGKTFKCHTLSDMERKQIFDHFWSLTWKERKMLVKTSTDVNLTQRARDRKEDTKSRRSYSFKFYLYINKMTKVRVCKRTLLATLSLGEWMVNNWLEDGKEDDVDVSLQAPEAIENTRQSKRISRQQDLNNRLRLLKGFLSALPKVESHYCRASSTKLYLEPNYSSKAQVFQLYVDNWCKEKNSKPLSSCTFHKTFEDMNLSLYRPKKDQCDSCRAHKLNHISEEDYNTHIKRKDAARDAKTQDKTNEEYVFTIDLQSLLLCPRSNASALIDENWQSITLLYLI